MIFKGLHCKYFQSLYRFLIGGFYEACVENYLFMNVSFYSQMYHTSSGSNCGVGPVDGHTASLNCLTVKNLPYLA